MFFIAAVASAALGCQRPKDNDAPVDRGATTAPAQSEADRDAPLAKIDDEVITVGEFQERINQQSPYVRGRYTSVENQREFLTSMIRFEVLALEARRRGLDKDPDAIRAMKQVMIQKLMAAEFESAGKAERITDEELRAYYDQNPNRYNKPEEVRVAAIVLPDRATADKVSKLATGAIGKTNKGFRDLVEKYSTDQESKKRGGDLRYFSRDNQTIPQPVIDTAFKLGATGAVSGVIDAGDGRFFIVKQTGKRKAIEKPFESVKLQIRNRLARQKRSSSQREFIEGLKKKTKIEVFDANLEKVRIDHSRSSINSGKHGGDTMDPTADPTADPTGGAHPTGGADPTGGAHPTGENH